MADIEPVKQNQDLEPEQKRKVFIGSLSYNIDENAFRDYWTKFGAVIEASILRDRDGHSRGFGFVTFADPSSVDAVMQARPHTLDNRVVEPKRAIPREETHKPNMQLSVKKLYLGGVKEPITENDLKDYFSKFGTIVDVVVMKDRDGQYRGYGFVEFDDYDPVDKIILEKSHVVCGRQLDVQKAQSRDGSQRSGNTRSRQGPPSTSRSNYNSGGGNGGGNGGGGGYNNYQQDNMNDPFGQMPNNNFNGYGSNFNEGNGNWTSFGQGYGQQNVGGPMRRGNMGGGGGGGGGHGRGYAPYNGRGGGGGRGRGGGNRGGPSWTSWN
ncbi:unnamed protein product [Rotaria sp. Silwood1]|nr:unnamed protein product [Rotaria sp. Silwood1]CAF3658002.1 unnamed protein product [Rotaria sp. Silwood1]CAF3707672.1 unnamed protein product [Rotaria sp. Silwood1]CAF4772449.1 unnamed protein product [Rotaria sp. Silwood1]CAF4802457.1 unnamed protein product [Rotaria sp. Silwood1]